MSPNKMSASKSAQYPEPLIYPAVELPHQQVIILLHGRGSNADKFGPKLLSTQIPGYGTLQQAFPRAKFVFPTASKRRALIYKRSIINQWFDNWRLTPPTERQELQIGGLRESCGYVHQLVLTAVEEVGAQNVVLGGLSQGCAASLVSILLWDGPPLAAIVGMCGHLPFRASMEQATSQDGDEKGWEFGSDDGDGDAVEDGNTDEKDLGTQNHVGLPEKSLGGRAPGDLAVSWLREELELESLTKDTAAFALPYQKIPLFLGHGSEDDKVPVHLGREAASFLEKVDMDVEWKEYVGLGHWYSGAMLHDMVIFLHEKTRWTEGS